MMNLINLLGTNAIRRVFFMKQYLFVIWIEDNSVKLVVCCCVLDGTDKDGDGIGTMEEDIFLRQLENTMRNLINLHGVKGICRPFLMEQY